MHILTQRCVIRPFTAWDIDGFMAYRNDGDWMRYQSFKGLTRQQYVDALLTPVPECEGIQLVLAQQQTNEIIGDLYLKQESDVYWIGYTVAPRYARQGYANEAVAAAVAWIVANRCPVVRAAVMPDNLPSIGLLQKLGFVCVGTDEEHDLLFEYRAT